MRWVQQNYTKVGTIGAEPFTTRRFGITILRLDSLEN
jgi:hypothetical protein